jgi:hypothetical protein
MDIFRLDLQVHFFWGVLLTLADFFLAKLDDMATSLKEEHCKDTGRKIQV